MKDMFLLYGAVFCLGACTALAVLWIVVWLALFRKNG